MYELLLVEKVGVATWPIVRDVASLFAYVMQGIYALFESFNIINVGVCIVFFVFISRMIMLPLTIKQNRNAFINRKTIPIMTQIHEKYKNSQNAFVKTKSSIEKLMVLEYFGSGRNVDLIMLFINLPIMMGMYAVILNFEYFVPHFSALTQEEMVLAFNFLGFDLS